MPRTEDVGIDVFVTLLSRDGSLLRAADTIQVQLKSESVSHIYFDADANGNLKLNGETSWLRALSVPFFIGSVSRVSNGKPGSLLLYTTHGLYGWLCNNAERDGVGVCFRSNDKSEGNGSVPVVNLGPPIVELDMAKLDDSNHRQQMIEIIQEWARICSINRKINPVGMGLNCKWDTNVMPADFQYNIGLAHLNSPDGIRRANRDAALSLLPVLTERLLQGSDDDINHVVQVLEDLKSRGVDLVLDDKDIKEQREKLRQVREKRQREIKAGAPEEF